MSFYSDKQLNTIGLNLSSFLSIADKTQINLADELGVSRQAVNKWIKGVRMKRETLPLLAQLFSRDLGIMINPEDFLEENFADSLEATLKSTVQHDPSYIRTPLSIEEFISKNKKSENLDEHDEEYLLSLYSRGSKLDKVSEGSIRNMLRAFRENIKEQWISGKE